MRKKVLGTVQWFSVRNGYGFINRNDTKEDVFVHLTAIKKNSLKRYLHSVGHGRTVEFDVVEGEQGAKAAKVTDPGGAAVHGNKYISDLTATSTIPGEGALTVVENIHITTGVTERMSQAAAVVTKAVEMGERVPPLGSSAGPLNPDDGVICHTLDVGVTRTRKVQTRAIDQ